MIFAHIDFFNFYFMNREKAWIFLNEYTKSQSLIRHALAVEAAMRAYAKKFGEDEEKWGIVGLLHDFDYEMYPDQHPQKGGVILRDNGVSNELIEAILGHATYTGVSRVTLMAKTLFAVDELAGFVLAVAYVGPEGLAEMKAQSVKKKLKDKAFAAKVNREDISLGIKELGVNEDEHIIEVIEALYGIGPDLGF